MIVYLFIIPLPRGRRAIMPRRNKKERTKKKRVGAEDTPSTPAQAIDARMEEEKKKRKQKKKQKNRELAPNSAT